MIRGIRHCPMSGLIAATVLYPLSFVCTPLATVKYVHVCMKRVSIRVSVLEFEERREEDDLATDENVET